MWRTKRRRDERFVEAIRQNRAGMFRVARSGVLRSDSDAEEAVADATESAYAHLHTLRNSRAAVAGSGHDVASPVERMPQDAQTAEDEKRRAATRRCLTDQYKRAMRRKSGRRRSNWMRCTRRLPLTMFYADGMKLEEIAAALHVPKGTVSGADDARAAEAQRTWMEERTMTEREIGARLRNERIPLPDGFEDEAGGGLMPRDGERESAYCPNEWRGWWQRSATA